MQAFLVMEVTIEQALERLARGLPEVEAEARARGESGGPADAPPEAEE